MALSANVTIKGLATIKWGAGDVAGSPFTSAIVNSIEVSNPNASPIFIQDTEGLDKVMVLLNNGRDFVVECLYDTAIFEGSSKPEIGDQVDMTVPSISATALECWITDVNPSYRAGAQATIRISLVHRTGIPHPA